MNKFRLIKAGINPSEGIERFNNVADTYERYLYKFVEDTNYDEMCKAIACGDVKQAFASAHALKGVAGNLSLTKLYEDIVPLVEELRTGRLENAEALSSPVREDYEKVIGVLSGKRDRV